MESFLPFADQANVTTEKPTDRLPIKRRIDIHLDFQQEAAIAIENKPWDDDMADDIIQKTQAVYTALSDANLLDQLGGNPPPP